MAPAYWKECNCGVGKTKQRKQRLLSWEKAEPECLEAEPYDTVTSPGAVNGKVD